MTVICDHPGWTLSGQRTLSSDHGVWIAASMPRLEVRPVAGDLTGPVPVVDTYTPDALGSAVPRALAEALTARGPVQRVRTPSLWEALGTAIIRQVIRADQARLMYERFCSAHGRPLGGAPSAFPSPRYVLDLIEQDFTELGMKFKARPLRAAAEAFVEYGAKWQGLKPDLLVDEVQAVPRIGPWTAGAAVADFTGDFSLYPYGDMAVRKWVSTAAPGIDWPDDEATFAAQWRSFASTRAELSTLTVLTLALGGARGTDTPSD